LETTGKTTSHLTRLSKGDSQVIGYALDITLLYGSSQSSCARLHTPVARSRTPRYLRARNVSKKVFWLRW
jgi:hypothetical protein